MDDRGFASFKLVLAALGAMVGGAWLGVGLSMQALLLLMLIDYITGLCAAFVTRQADSGVGWRGITKKVLVILGISAVWAFARQLPLSPTFGVDAAMIAASGVASAYTVIEMLSIVENLDRAGVNVGPIRDYLAKAQQRRPSDPTPAPTPAPGGKL